MSLGHTKIPYLSALYHATTGCNGPVGRDGRQHRCPGCWAEDLVRSRLAGTMKGLPSGKCGGVVGETAGHECGSQGMGFVGGPCQMGKDRFSPTFHADRLQDPLRARKPQVIGLSFFGDWLDRGITLKQVDEICLVAEKAVDERGHTIISLTKNSRLPEVPNHWLCTKSMWIGASCRNQREVDMALAGLRPVRTSRWLSLEPLHEAVDLHGLPGVDLVVVGGESAAPGKTARPCDLRWIRSVVQQCQAAGVAWWVKQLGSNPMDRCEDDQSPAYGQAVGWGGIFDDDAGFFTPGRAGEDVQGWPNDVWEQRGALPWQAALDAARAPR